MPERDAHIFWLVMNSRNGGGFEEGVWPTEYLGSIHSTEDTAEKADPVGMTICHDVVLETLLLLDKK